MSVSVASHVNYTELERIIIIFSLMKTFIATSEARINWHLVKKKSCSC
jgi:hypothetical protein